MMDVIPLDATLLKGSHGRRTDDPCEGPVIVSSEPRLLPDAPVAATAIKDIVLRHVKGNQVQASELLGISRTTLRAKLRELGLTVEKHLRPESDRPE